MIPATLQHAATLAKAIVELTSVVETLPAIVRTLAIQIHDDIDHERRIESCTHCPGGCK